MALTHVQRYEALKPSVGEEAARLMDEVVPPAEHLATKTDLAGLRAEFAELRAEFAQLRGEMREGFAQLRSELHADRVSMFKWLFAFMIPVWTGSIGTALAVVLKA